MPLSRLKHVTRLFISENVSGLLGSNYPSVARVVADYSRKTTSTIRHLLRPKRGSIFFSGNRSVVDVSTHKSHILIFNKYLFC